MDVDHFFGFGELYLMHTSPSKSLILNDFTIQKPMGMVLARFHTVVYSVFIARFDFVSTFVVWMEEILAKPLPNDYQGSDSVGSRQSSIC